MIKNLSLEMVTRDWCLFVLFICLFVCLFNLEFLEFICFFFLFLFI